MTAPDKPRIRLGWYLHPNHIPLRVVDKGTPEHDPHHGPWIHYHLEGDNPNTAAPVVWSMLEALLDAGYVHESEYRRPE